MEKTPFAQLSVASIVTPHTVPEPVQPPNVTPPAPVNVIVADTQPEIVTVKVVGPFGQQNGPPDELEEEPLLETLLPDDPLLRDEPLLPEDVLDELPPDDALLPDDRLLRDEPLLPEDRLLPLEDVLVDDDDGHGQVGFLICEFLRSRLQRRVEI